MSSAETKNRHHDCRSKPRSQNSIDHIKNASIITSHITFVAEMRNTGVKRVSSAATHGFGQNRRANTNVPKIDKTGQIKNARWSATSLQPKMVATPAM